MTHGDALDQDPDLARDGYARAGECAEHPQPGQPGRARRRTMGVSVPTACWTSRTCDSSPEPRFGACSKRRGYAVAHMEALTQPAWVDRYVIARRPGRIVTRNLSIAFRNREDLEDVYAFQYVVDARTAGAQDLGTLALPPASEVSPIV